MSKIEVGRYSDRLRRTLGMKGVSEVAGELSPEISPVMVLEDVSLEWLFLQQVRACGSATVLVGNVANESIIRWRNPAGSGVIARFTHLDYFATQNVIHTWGYSTPAVGDLPTASVTAVFDHRWADSGGVDRTTIRTSRTSAGTTIALASSIFVASPQLQTAYQWDGEIILLPGEAVELGSSGSVDVNLNASARWTERQLPALEE